MRSWRASARHARATATAVAVAAVLATAGCANQPRWYSPDGKPVAAHAAANVTVTAPADGATNVPAAVEITYTSDAASTTVELTDASGVVVEGSLRADKSSWVPAQTLKYGTQYTAKVTGASTDGKSDSKTVTFTTMAKPGSTARASSAIGDGQVVGVGMPIILSFSSDIPEAQRAAVQKRLFVTSEPAQEGIWYWWSAKEVHYRPKEYWQSGTKLSVRAAIGGLSLGGTRYGSADLTVTAQVGAKIIMEADNATKQMTVTRDGQLLKTIPVSFGKKATPSASGNLIVMIKNPWEWFDSSSFGIPSESSGGYRTKVYWPQRLTWDGEYIHAAPWSEKDQGKRNVSHGCTNVSNANAEWLYNLTQIGDPVIIKGTEQHVTWQNGWTDWDRPWEEYVKGSAIPYVAPATDPAAGPSVSGSPAASPSASTG